MENFMLYGVKEYFCSPLKYYLETAKFNSKISVLLKTDFTIGIERDKYI